MEIGVSLPAMITGVTPGLVLEWAHRIDRGPFSSAALGERAGWPGYETLTTLAAAAAVTTRVRLVTAVLVLPLHDEVTVGRQAASIDRLSAGRFVLGVGVGGRRADYDGRPELFTHRSRRMAEQVARMRATWRGEPLAPDTRALGPAPATRGGPLVLAGVTTERGVDGSAPWADGIFSWSFGPDPRRVERLFRAAETAWRRAGRATSPRRVAGWYFGLGPNAPERVVDFVTRYHSDFDDDRLAAIVAGLRRADDTQMRNALRAFADIGTDEVLLTCALAEPEQLDRLAQVVA